jgi:hypothetical protein
MAKLEESPLSRDAGYIAAVRWDRISDCSDHGRRNLIPITGVHRVFISFSIGAANGSRHNYDFRRESQHALFAGAPTFVC